MSNTKNYVDIEIQMKHVSDMTPEELREFRNGKNCTTTDEGWINEVGSYLSKDFGRVLLFPFLFLWKGMTAFGRFLSVSRNVATLIELCVGIAAWSWVTFNWITPSFNGPPNLYNYPLVIVWFTASILIPLVILVSKEW